MDVIVDLSLFCLKFPPSRFILRGDWEKPAISLVRTTLHMSLESVLDQDLEGGRVSRCVYLSFFPSPGFSMPTPWAYLPVASASVVVGCRLQGQIRVGLFRAVELTISLCRPPPRNHACDLMLPGMQGLAHSREMGGGQAGF